MFSELYFAFFAASTWINMFALDDTVTWAEKIIRPMIVYIALIAMLRLFGKRELAQLNPFDLVVILSLSNTVQNAIIGQDNSLVGGIAGAASLLAINYAVSRLKFSSKTAERITEGAPIRIIEHGKINEDARNRELITKRDLDIIAHQHGYEDASDIEKLVLDPNGTFLVDGKEEVKDAKFKKEVLKKIGDLSKQLTELNAAFQKR